VPVEGSCAVKSLSSTFPYCRSLRLASLRPTYPLTLERSSARKLPDYARWISLGASACEAIAPNASDYANISRDSPIFHARLARRRNSPAIIPDDYRPAIARFPRLTLSTLFYVL